MITLPSLLLGVLISSLYGAVFHLWRGGDGGRLFTYLIFSWIGFWLGHFVGYIFSFTIANLGPLRLGTATIGSILILGLGYWLSLVEAEEGDF